MIDPALPLVRAAVALGSNLGDRREIIESAWREIDAIPGVRIDARAPVIETQPVAWPGIEPGGCYLNSVVLIGTILEPVPLLAELQRIERAHGRIRDPALRWTARTLDLDLLLYADRAIDVEGLRVPHPRLSERLFVLEPLAAVAPHWAVPTLGRTVRQLLEALRERTGVQCAH